MHKEGVPSSWSGRVASVPPTLTGPRKDSSVSHTIAKLLTRTPGIPTNATLVPSPHLLRSTTLRPLLSADCIFQCSISISTSILQVISPQNDADMSSMITRSMTASGRGARHHLLELPAKVRSLIIRKVISSPACVICEGKRDKVFCFMPATSTNLPRPAP